MKNILKTIYHKIDKNYQSEYLSKKEFDYLKNKKKILDVGCGEGEFLAFDPKKVVGLDGNRKSVKICKKNNLQAVYGKATKLPFPKDSFDGIHCGHVIEHLMPDDAYKMLSEISRVLKKNGIFVLSTPIMWGGFFNDFTHIKPYNYESIVRYLVHEGHNKTLHDFPYKYEKLDFYWRYRPLPFPGRAGYLIANYLYQFGIHTLSRDAYTLVLRKK